ncbi:MAG: oligosaccharide flippase family protein [Bacteroidetes bacterium]|nr:oligosaccharide flippase family protein [Bacteroidota bacterium]
MKIQLRHIVDLCRKGIRKNGFYAVVDQGIISGMNFLTFLVLARWMEVTEFGQYILIFTVLLFVQSVQHALITRAHNVLGAKQEGKEYSHLTKSVVKLVLVFGMLTTLLFVGFGFIFSWLSWSPWSNGAFALAIGILPWMLQDAIRRILYTSERIAAATLNDAICYVLQLAAILVLIKASVTGSALTVFYVLSGSSLIAAVWGLFQIRTYLTGFFKGNEGLGKVAKQLWQFGKWLTTGEFIGWIGQNGNTWVIGAFMGAPLVAGYRAATYVTNLLNPLDLSVSNYLPVKASQIVEAEGRPAMIAWLRKQALMLCIPYAILVMAISVGAMELLTLFFDVRYATELFAVVLSVSALARLFAFAALFAKLGLIATENNRPVMVAQFISLALFATVTIGLISWVGILGAPLSRIVQHVVIGVFLAQALVKPELAARLSLDPTTR